MYIFRVEYTLSKRTCIKPVFITLFKKSKICTDFIVFMNMNSDVQKCMVDANVSETLADGFGIPVCVTVHQCGAASVCTCLLL